jgi:hypothetical protein
MIVEEVKIQTGESTRTVKELRKELKDLKDQLLSTQQGTEEYNKTMRRAADIQHELREQMQEINNSAMDFGQKLGNVTKTMTGVSGAITAATGALSLFGIENEEAQKKITATMTSLIGITEGLSKMDDGIKAFKRLSIAVNSSSKAMGVFKTALISTGIGALVVVLGSIIAYWDEFTEAIGLSAKQMERLGDIARGVFNVFTSSLKGIAQALGKMIKGDFSGAWESLKNGFNVVQNFNEGVAKSEAKREEARTKKAKEEADKRAKIAEDEYKKRIDAVQKLAKYEKDLEAARTRGEESGRYTQGAYDREMKYFDTLFAVYRKDSDEYKNLVLEKEQFLQDWENHFAEEAKREQEANDKKAEAEGKAAEAEIERAHQARLDLLQSFDEDLMTEQQKIDQRYQMLIDAATKEGEDTTNITKWYESEKTRIVKEEEEKQMEIRKASIKNYTSLAGNIGSIIGSIGDMMEEGTAEQKGLAIAATTIQMLTGIATALAGAFTTKTGPWDIALAATQAASIAAAGIASITKISQVKSDGSGASISVPSVNMGAVVASAPEFVQSVDGAMTQTAITDQKVYVTEHDITETQKKVQVAQNRATY